MKIKKKDILSVTDLNTKEIRKVFNLAKKLKKELKTKGKNQPILRNKSLALVFEKQSLRTRISFDIGMAQLGGHVVYLATTDTGMGARESEADIAKVLSSMVSIIAARTHSQKTVEEIAKNSQVPVINALTDLEHPCQALADLFTILEVKGKLDGLTIGYVGDGDNNVAHSLALASSMLGMSFNCGSPKGFWMNKKIVDSAKDFKGKIFQTEDPKEAVKGVDVVITDTWVSMGDEKEKKERLRIFKPFQVNKELMSLAKKEAIFLHCLPAYRGNEVSTDIIDEPQSVIFQEAENRMHLQKALMVYLLKA